MLGLYIVTDRYTFFDINDIPIGPMSEKYPNKLGVNFEFWGLIIKNIVGVNMVNVVKIDIYMYIGHE